VRHRAYVEFLLSEPDRRDPQVARELEARYVLEGSVRRSGDRLPVTARLIDAGTGTHIWAERCDRTIADLFVVQDEITEAVAVAIGGIVSSTEQLRALRRPRPT
jgi:TolB-like protein